MNTPVHASWLNQIEIYFAVLQRKLLTPNDFPDLRELESRILAFQACCDTIAEPFEWKFTRTGLRGLLDKVKSEPKTEPA